MKLKIEKAFTDKHTNEKYIVGDVKEFEQARAKELLADNRGLVSAVDEPKKAPTKKPNKTTNKVEG